MKIFSTFLFLAFSIQSIFSACVTSDDVKVNKYTTYKNKAYDIVNYTKHPDCQSCLKSLYGNPLEPIFNKYSFHKTNSKAKKHLEEIYVGDLCSSSSTTTTNVKSTTSKPTSQTTTSSASNPTITTTITTSKENITTTNPTQFPTLPTSSSSQENNPLISNGNHLSFQLLYLLVLFFTIYVFDN